MKVSRYPDLQSAQAEYLRTVDSEASSARSRYITTGTGQSMTYEEKITDARAYLADSSADVPWLEAEAEATGQTMTEAAQRIVDRRAEVQKAGIAIERERIKAKEAIRAAGTVRDMYDALVSMRKALPNE